MRVFESFDSFLNEGYDANAAYNLFKKIGRDKIERKPAYTQDLFGSSSFVELTPAQDKEINTAGIPVYTSKDLWGRMAPRYIGADWSRVPAETVFILYLNHEQGELKDYYGNCVFVNTEGASYMRYGFGMDFEPELHLFAMGIPESVESEEESDEDELEDEEGNEITESSRIELKRRYTEFYPQVTVSKYAPVRNRIIETIADGKMSTEEFETIIKEFSTASKKWARNNRHYFNVTEDGISLSKYGKRILSKIKVVNENE